MGTVMGGGEGAGVWMWGQEQVWVCLCAGVSVQHLCACAQVCQQVRGLSILCVHVCEGLCMSGCECDCSLGPFRARTLPPASRPRAGGWEDAGERGAL